MAACGSELDDERLSVGKRRGGAQGARALESAQLHAVDADAVVSMIDYSFDIIGELE